MEKLLDKFIEINEKYIELKLELEMLKSKKTLELEMLKSKKTIEVSELAKYFDISGEYAWIKEDKRQELIKLLNGDS